MRDKCRREGCKFSTESRNGFQRPSHSFSRSAVADSVVQERLVCRRWFCGESTPWKSISRQTLSGLTLDSDVASILRRDGEVWF